MSRPDPKILTRHFGEERLHELETYRRLGGYEGLRQALSLGREKIRAEVAKSNLRGLGGAGFSAGLKWSTVPPEEKNPGPRFVVANCDESEPGCFKDRVLVDRAPHQLLEGLLIAAYAIDARHAFIFIRGEYAVQYRILEKALAQAEAAGLAGRDVLGSGFFCRVSLMRGAGAYISGLDTALLETMEGKRAWPRQPPPFPTAFGLMGRPTVVHNVETLSMLPHIALRGGEWFAGLGTAKSGGTALFSVSGHVERPGVYEFPMGTPLREVIAAAGGVRAGRKLKAVIPGGVSTPVLTAEEIDVAMDFEGPRAKGSFLGAGGVIVLDDTTDMAAVAHNIERFFCHESCGQCTPCREGSYWHERILQRGLEGGGTAEDLATLSRVGENIAGKVICALGDTVGVVTRAMMKKFPEDFKARFPESRG
ncbi:MAG TPA: NADH-quinone oxidoreductase subunit NuoF [Elusimicrobia bacterium]|nr:NADH-quinone oxidoreductase subunit NuoF [Elusimicrobiota bacterium]HBT61944.1 NADH-quinone oxidoreductase subunit NuoF [Elusimicrobiota bacterium]